MTLSRRRPAVPCLGIPRRRWMSGALGRRAALLCLAGAMGACVQAPQKPAPVVTVPPPRKAEAPPPKPPAPPRVSDAERLLNYYEYALNLPSDQLAQEQERTLRFFGERRSDFALMQLVLLRCLPGATAKDRAQAQEMLSSYLKEAQDSWRSSSRHRGKSCGRRRAAATSSSKSSTPWSRPNESCWNATNPTNPRATSPRNPRGKNEYATCACDAGR
jgi:hypothetical protein